MRKMETGPELARRITSPERQMPEYISTFGKCLALCIGLAVEMLAVCSVFAGHFSLC